MMIPDRTRNQIYYPVSPQYHYLVPIDGEPYHR